MKLRYLKHNLRPRYNKNFVKWRYSNKKNKSSDLHHILGSMLGGNKLNDYLLAEIDSDYHREITSNRKATPDEIDEMMIDALNGLFDYIEDLEKIIIMLRG